MSTEFFTAVATILRSDCHDVIGCGTYFKRINTANKRFPTFELGRKEPFGECLATLHRQVLGAMRILIIRDGIWLLLECPPACEEHWPSDCFTVFAW